MEVGDTKIGGVMLEREDTGFLMRYFGVVNIRYDSAARVFSRTAYPCGRRTAVIRFPRSH